MGDRRAAERPAMVAGRLALGAILVGLAEPAAALDLQPPAGPVVEVHAFVSQGLLKSTGNTYLTKSRPVSFALTEVGINFTSTLTDRLRVGIQLFAGGFVPTQRFDVKADWFYLDYRWADWLGFRAGRVKLPFGLFNEISDIDSARVPILLPPSVYPAQNRNFLLAQTGGELYGYLRLGAGGALDYRFYAGTIFIDAPASSGLPYVLQRLDAPYVTGARLMWETPLQGLRAGGSIQALRLDAALRYPMETVQLEIPALLWVGSLEYTRNDLLLAAEYSRWRSEVRTSNPALFPAVNQTVSERYYGLAAYRLATWLQVGAYYSGFYRDVDQRAGRAAMQHDVAATLRFDINPHWLVKLEGHYLRGTASLDRALNDNRSLDELARDWGLFLVKTTAYF
jgi:hypothetical protein